MPDNPFEPMIKNIGDYVSGTLYAQGVIPPIGIDNYEGLALTSTADTHLLAAKDPVIDEIAVGMTGNEIKGEYVTGTPPLTLSDSEGYPLQWWQVNLSPYQEGTGDPAPDNVRPIHGTDKVTIYTDSKYGGLVEWNQLVKNGNFADTLYWDAYSATFTVSDNVATVTSGSATLSFLYQAVQCIIGHKYLVSAEVRSGDIENCYVYWDATSITASKPVTSDWHTYTALYVGANNGLNLSIRPNDVEVGDKWQLRNTQIFDLTQMFGAGNEPATVDEFRALFPNDYYAYNAGGTLMTVDQVNGISYTPAVITLPATGKNLLNIDAGTHNAWAFVNIPNNLRPDTEYTFSLSGNTGYTYTLYLGNSIQSTRPLSQAITGGGNSTFTTPANMSGEPFLAIAGDVSGAGNEPIASLLPQIELGSSATAYKAYTNTIYSGQVYTGGAVSNWGVVDLSTLTWQTTVNRAINESLNGIVKPPTSTSTVSGSYAEQYKEIAATGTLTNGTYAFLEQNNVVKLYFFYDGVNLPTGKLVFPLLNPTSLTLSTPSVPTPKGNAVTWATAEDGVVDSMEVTYIKTE